MNLRKKDENLYTQENVSSLSLWINTVREWNISMFLDRQNVKQKKGQEGKRLWFAEYYSKYNPLSCTLH